MNFFKKLFAKTTSAPAPSATPAISNVKNYRITGVSHYEKNIASLGVLNPAYSLTKRDLIKAKRFDECIYQYTFTPHKTELIPEPTNPHDPNAIKVVIDGAHVGYIKAGSCKQILKMIDEDRIASITSRISGGAYKMLICHDDACTDCEIDKGKNSYSVQISITEK